MSVCLCLCVCICVFARGRNEGVFLKYCAVYPLSEVDVKPLRVLFSAVPSSHSRWGGRSSVGQAVGLLHNSVQTVGLLHNKPVCHGVLVKWCIEGLAQAINYMIRLIGQGVCEATLKRPSRPMYSLLTLSLLLFCKTFLP